MKKYSSIMLTIKIIAFISLFGIHLTQAQNPSHNVSKRTIQFPDIPAYVTLKCDFHMHTIFSDGYVWPNIRVEEALKDGLDAISLTEHLEYQPYKKDIPHPDRNRAYELAKEYNKDNKLIIINGSELTRNMPPGHFNAIFIEDANKLLLEDPMEVLREAKRQGAFIFWNHPNWFAQKPDGIAEFTEMHQQIYDEGLMHGIEIVNDLSYSEGSVKIAKEMNLCILGNSDVHGLVDWHYKLAEGGHRPITLIFAKERSEEGIREALKNHRTVAYFDHTLTGDKKHLIPLIEASLKVINIEIIQTWAGPSSVVDIEIRNTSSLDFTLENTSSIHGLYSHSPILILKANRTTAIQVKNPEELDNFELSFKVINAFMLNQEHPIISLSIEVEAPLEIE